MLSLDGMKDRNMQELEGAISLYDKNRSLSHIPKVELIKGDITTTAKEYVKNNRHLIVSLLYLDCGIYKPTKSALEVFVPRMPNGSVIVFDELNVNT